MNKKLFLLLSFLILAATYVNGQGMTCETSEPFCTGTIYTFPAGTSGTAQQGAYYGCLATQPAPAWYHMLIDDPGSITIYMYSTPLVDIDFICWGPFADPYSPCVAGLTANKVVDCSYSPNPTEYCDIPNGQTGQYYILLITNYSQQPCNITFSQTSGNGSTDCTILPPPTGNNGPLCVGETLQLNAAFVVNASYWWTGPAGFLSTQQNPVINNVTMANAGTYACTITVNGNSSDPSTTDVIIHNLPTATLLSDDTTICHGTSAAIQMQLTGWGPFQVDYNDGTNNFTATNLWGPVGTIYLSPTTPATYYFTKVRDSHCERNLILSSVDVDLHPLTSATISGSSSICAGEPAQLTFNLNGTPPWYITYTANGTNPQNTVANSSPHTISVFPVGTTTYAIAAVTDLHCSGQVMGSAQITVAPSPNADAGSDQTLPYGATTTLNGQANGGSGNYAYAWSPADKLVDPGLAQPLTVNLTETTLFTLTVTDNDGGCQDQDEMIVNISGGPLGCSPYAYPNVICHNLTTQLYAMASGGSGEYTFMWSSVPAGFSSTLQNPVVQPDQTTTYYVAVNDGYNVSNGIILVTVYPRPVPNAGNDQTIPHGTATQLSGSGSGGSSFSYHWEPADKLVDPTLPSPVTANLYSTTVFTLTLTDLTTGCSSTGHDEVIITVGGDALAASPVAIPDEICFGISTKLYSSAGGGSGQYTYNWSSVPAGFMSTEPNPEVTPIQTTLYTVAVNDGFNTAFGYVNVTVLDAPELNLGPQSRTVCVYDTVILDAGNPGSSYLWSNGSTEQTIGIATTGIGFDMQTPSVTVTSQSGCQATASVTIVFDFAACTGIDDTDRGGPFRVYPNPGDGRLNLVFDQRFNDLDVLVTNILGQTVFGPRNFQGMMDSESILIDLGHQPDGLYFIRIHADDKVSHAVKYILNH